MLGSLHANRDKIIKHIKPLCWSNKVETGNAVFKMTRSVFSLLAGASWMWWSSVVFGCLYYALCFWCTSCFVVFWGCGTCVF